MTVKDRLARLRVKAGLTQEELGQRLLPPLPQYAISRIESGRRKLLADDLPRFAKALGLPDITSFYAQTPVPAAGHNGHARRKGTRCATPPPLTL